jgi:hypothetical protein
VDGKKDAYVSEEIFAFIFRIEEQTKPSGKMKVLIEKKREARDVITPRGKISREKKREGKRSVHTLMMEAGGSSGMLVAFY